MVLYLKQTVGEKTNMSEAELHLRCLRCGRKLKTEDAKMKGYGPICQAKILSNKQSLLFAKESENAKK